MDNLIGDNTSVSICAGCCCVWKSQRTYLKHEGFKILWGVALDYFFIWQVNQSWDSSFFIIWFIFLTSVCLSKVKLVRLQINGPTAVTLFPEQSALEIKVASFGRVLEEMNLAKGKNWAISYMCTRGGRDDPL